MNILVVLALPLKNYAEQNNKSDYSSKITEPKMLYYLVFRADPTVTAMGLWSERKPSSTYILCFRIRKHLGVPFIIVQSLVDPT